VGDAELVDVAVERISVVRSAIVAAYVSAPLSTS
jgi:hypothetical protein